MKARTYILLLAVLSFAAMLPVHAQDQGTAQGGAQSGSVQSGPQGASMLPASNVDTQGIRRYVLGPGDVLDVRVFGQPDLNWQGEVEADGNIT
ncbi:MAG TPA: polysaccharide biosynthesis/export family protein, partial [Pyrinomonadaceae bacterium]|nr:polysaccharide biosynthesis/export family protein [Pyrinomonadaceae bacterium]